MIKSKTRMAVGLAAGVAMAALAAGSASAATAPSVLKIGTLYAGSGPFAVASQSEYQGLQFWAANVNKAGGVFVKAFDKKIPVKIIAYDDQSSTSTATTLYNQLITQDKVDLLVSDFGSVLTSVAVPLAAEHHMLLIDPTGSGANFFTKKTRYLADVSIPTSTVWPEALAHYLLEQKIKKIAIIYGSNDFDASQATELKRVLGKGGVDPVYFHSVPTTESNYTVLLHTVAARHPDAVIEFGYANNDIAFLHALSASGLHFNMTFTVFPGQLLSLLTKNVGAKALAYTYTYPTPPLVKYSDVNAGMNTDDFVKEFTAEKHEAPNYLTVAGYNAGVIMQGMLKTSPTFSQTAFDQALLDMSGKTKTLLGEFRMTDHGSQIGELFPIAQLIPEGDSNKIVVVYPKDKATGTAVYPAPK
ncbi:MAG TPA: ABC transporter substrate-binding protein [Acidiphilium sp.]